MKLEPHPIAALLPEMDDSQFAELREDIRANGQLQAITVYEGKILDGRHRYRACREIGIPPRTELWDGEDPAAYVLSLNVRRRHLTTSQRAMLATRFLPALREEARERQREHGGTAPGRASQHSDSKEPECSEPDRATKRAGELVGVSRASVTRAARIAERAPEMVEPILSGEKTVSSVDRAIRDSLPPAPRKKEAAAPPPGSTREAHVTGAQRDRINRLVWALDGYVKGLPALKVDLALKAATDDEIQHWRTVLAEAAKSFRALRSQLEES